MNYNGKQLLDLLNPLDYEVLVKLEPTEKYLTELVEQAITHLPAKKSTLLSNAELLRVYKELNNDIRTHKPRRIQQRTAQLLDDYLQIKGFVDVPHYLAHLPRIAPGQQARPVEQALVQTHRQVTYNGTVSGLQEAPLGIKLLIDAGTPRINFLEAVYTHEITAYQPH